MTTEMTQLVGQTLGQGRYQVKRKLGEGGMAFALLALDNNLGTDVVLKVPKPVILADAEFGHRFRREIRSMVELTHPHIVKIKDVGEHDGMPFYVMDLLPGGSLLDRFEMGEDGKQKPLPPESLADWLGSVAAALDFIHQRFIHRDIKPGNILFDADGNAYVSDFGIVKAISDGTTENPQTMMTQAGKVIGTSLYMAPELIDGSNVDGRADQYALAVTVYQVLSGRVPFQGTSFLGIVKQQLTGKIPPLHELVASLPGSLTQVVEKGLSLDPQDRFTSCSAFAKAVLAEVMAIPITVVPIADGPRPRPRAVCPVCRKPFSLPPDPAGKSVTCPACGVGFTVAKKPSKSAPDTKRTVVSDAQATVKDTVVPPPLSVDGLEVIECPVVKPAPGIQVTPTPIRSGSRKTAAVQSDGKRRNMWILAGVGGVSAAGLGLVTLAGLVWFFWFGPGLKWFEKPPDDGFDALVKQGRQAMKEDRFAAAEEAYQQASKRRPKNAEAQASYQEAKSKREAADEKLRADLAEEAKRKQRAADLAAKEAELKRAKEQAALTKRINELLAYVDPLVKESKFADAREKIAEASKLGPVPPEYLAKVSSAEAALIAAKIAAIKRAADMHLKPGDDALTTRRFKDAIAHYDAAIKTLTDAEPTAPYPEQVAQWRRDVENLKTSARNSWDFALRNPAPVLNLIGCEAWVGPDAKGKRIVIATSAKVAGLWNAGGGLGQRILAGTSAQSMEAVNAGTALEIMNVPAASGKILAVNNNGKRFLGVNDSALGPVLKLWDAKKGTEMATLETGRSGSLFAKTIADGTRVLVGSLPNAGANVWDWDTGAKFAALKMNLGQTHSLLADHKRVVILDGMYSDPTIFEMESSQRIKTLPHDARARVFVMKLSPNGERIVCGCMDGTMSIWDMDTRSLVRTLKGHTGAIQDLAISRDGKYLVSSSFDNTVKIWNMANGTEIATLRGQNGLVSHVTISDDGKRIVCSEKGQTLKVWDRATESVIVTLRGSANPILVVSADGKRIAAGNGNNVKVWDLDREPHETILNVPKDK